MTDDDKPDPEIRTPSEPDESDMEAFIQGTDEASERSNTQTSGQSGAQASERSNNQTSGRPSTQTSEQSIAQMSEHSDASEEERRRTTVYFDPQTFRELKLYCAFHDLEMSETIDGAVSEFLEGKEPEV